MQCQVKFVMIQHVVNDLDERAKFTTISSYAIQISRSIKFAKKVSIRDPIRDHPRPYPRSLATLSTITRDPIHDHSRPCLGSDVPLPKSPQPPLLKGEFCHYLFKSKNVSPNMPPLCKRGLGGFRVTLKFP